MSYPLFEAVVGSQAQGLATPSSDVDVRGVFITPTSSLLSLGHTDAKTIVNNKEQDETTWELGHFLALCTKSNPNTLEVMRSPLVTHTGDKEDANELISLFPHCWSSRGAYDSARGMGKGQKHRVESGGPDDPRLGKHGVAWIRTHNNAMDLLRYHTLTVAVKEPYATMFRAWKAGKAIVPGRSLYDEILEKGEGADDLLDRIYEQATEKKTDYGPINAYLLRMRQKYWEGDLTS